jgi:hypothetical protein
MHYLYVNLWTGESEVFRLRYPEGDANVPPSALVTADVLEGQAPLSIHFEGHGSTDPDEQALGYRWDFGNGDTSTEAAPHYTFSTDGTYTVVLTVTDPFNAVDSASVVVRVGTPTAVEEPTLPEKHPRLAGNFPNPFSAHTVITFDTPAHAYIDLTIYDVLGRQVRRLRQGIVGPGTHKASWDGLGDNGRAAPNGLYFYQLQSDGRLVASRQMIRVR